MQAPIRRFLDRLASDIRHDAPDGLEALQDLWRSESERLPSHVLDIDLEPVSFESLVGYIEPVLQDMDVKVDNYKSEDRLDYTGERKTVIVIGGNTLSRGLTLEGLVVSYFVRTASAYDTLLQMGRWFGYRSGYEDLPRIWMTRELEEQFMALATVEAEIRDDVCQIRGGGPNTT